MRDQSSKSQSDHSALASPAANQAIPYSFQCSACGRVEHRPTPWVPEGWLTVESGDEVGLYCPDDAAERHHD